MPIGNNTSSHIFDTTFNANGILYSDASGVITSTAVGSATQVLTSNGAGVAPTFQAAGGGGGGGNSFFAYLAGNTGGLTGDGTTATFPYDTVVFDTGSGFNTGTGVYTIQAGDTGKWLFETTVYCFGIDGTNTAIIIDIAVNGTGFRTNIGNALTFSSSGALIITSSRIFSLTAGDTVNIAVTIGGAVKNVAFGGGATLNAFSGIKLA